MVIWIYGVNESVDIVLCVLETLSKNNLPFRLDVVLNLQTFNPVFSLRFTNVKLIRLSMSISVSS